MNRAAYLLCLGLIAALVSLPPASGQEEDKAVFSGPQKGEPLLPFKVMGVYDDVAGKELDFVAEASGKPLMLVFVHKLTRPSFGLTRILQNYCLERKKDGISMAMVWLHEADDRSKAEAYLTRARGSLRIAAPVGISLDGSEGPGAYGLNRNVTLTVIVGNENRVTANFALIQPSDSEAPKILGEVVKLIGGKPPTSEDLHKYGRYPDAKMRMNPRLVRILRQLEPNDLTSERLKKIVAQVDKFVGNRRELQQQLGSIAKGWNRRNATKSTAEGRAQIAAWAKKYGGMQAQRSRGRGGERDARLGNLLRSVISKGAAPDDVKKAIADVEKYIADEPALQAQLGDITSRVVGGRIFAEGGYGIPEAREQLEKWAKKYGPK